MNATYKFCPVRFILRSRFAALVTIRYKRRVAIVFVEYIVSVNYERDNTIFFIYRLNVMHFDLRLFTAPEIVHII